MQTTEGPLAIGGVWAEAPDSNLFYATQRSWLHAASRVFLGLRLRGAERIPATGGVMLVANHVSYLDPTTIACGLPRQIHFLAKQELLDTPGLGWYLRHVNTHAIKRGGGDRAAIRASVEVLKAGHAMLIFPEGTRSHDGAPGEPKPGAAMIALQAGVPVVPVHIEGTFRALPRGARFPRPARVTVTVGEPFDPGTVADSAPDRRTRYEVLGRNMMERIAALAH